MLLTPQHFQRQDRYHEERAQELLASAHPHPYGFARLQIDEQSLRNGRLAVVEASGVLPGGTPFDIPARDPAPRGLSVEAHMSPSQTELHVYLGLRVHRPGEPEVAAPREEEAQTRYRETTAKFADETGGGDARDMRAAAVNLLLLPPGDALGDFEALPVACVVRLPEGGFGLREEFVPPAVAVAASARMQRTVRKILEILTAKSTELADRRRMSGKGVAEFGRDDTAGFWLLGTVNGYIPILAHYLRTGLTHPEQVYATLVRLAGELATLSDYKVSDLPPYEHDDLGGTFGTLADLVPRLLETVLPRHYTRIPLEQREDGIFVGRLEDERVLDPSVTIYLGVYANVPAGDIQRGFPETAKIAAPDRIDALLAAALKGIDLRLTQSLPAALPAQAGWTYFQVEKQGEFWQGAQGARAIGIYAPPEYQGLLLEMIAVRG